MTSWILLENGTVIDGTGAPARRASVLIAGNRIVEVGDSATIERVPRGEDVRVIDAAEKTIMPGLIDGHCHLSYGESRTQEEQDLYTSVESRTLRAAFNAKKMLRAGVTSISQPGGSYYIGVAIRDAIRVGMVEGPRMTAAGRYLSTSNSLTDYYPDSVGVPEGSVGILTNTVHEMVSEVRHQVKNGVDLIKLADSPYGQYQAFTTDELKAISDLTHQLKKKVTIHARGPAEVGAAVDAGVDWIMHGNMMTDEVVEKLAKSKIPLVPTLLLLANFAQWGDRVGAPIGQRDGCRRMLEKTADSLHRAHAAGVKFVVGTDSGFSVTPYGEWHAREIELLMEYAGLSALEGIQAATSNAAALVNLEGEVGEILPGRLADLLVINGDPLANIRVLLDKTCIETVIKDGKEITFDDNIDRIRWPHDRAQVFSVGDLTYDLIYGSGEPPSGEERLPWSATDGMELAVQLKTIESQARIAGFEEEHPEGPSSPA
jgi:imidazolonepropionase-like amidohydrolase